MNDKDFDKRFHDHLKEDLDFPYDDKDWEKLAFRLDNSNPSAPVAVNNQATFWRKVLFGTLALLLLMNGWQLWHSAGQTQQNEALLTQMKALEARLLMATTTANDTIIVRKTDTVYLTRTVVKKVYVPTPISENTQLLSRAKSAGQPTNNSSVEQNLAQDTPSVKSGILGENEVFKNTIDVKNSTSKTENSTPNTPSVKNDIAAENMQITALMATIKGLENKLQQFENQYLANKNGLDNVSENNQVTNKNDGTNGTAALADSAKKAVPLPIKKRDSLQKPPLSITEPLPSKKPQTPRLFVGINGGFVNYSEKWLSTQGIEIGKNEQSYQVGLKAEYALTDRLRIVAGGDFCPFKFQTFWRDPRYNLPEPEPNTWERYYSATTRQELIQGFGGLKYMLTNGRNKWRPFVEFAYARMQIRPFSTIFEYQNKTTYAIRTHEISTSKVTIGKLLMLSGGVEYRLGKHWTSQAEAFYYYDLNRPRRTYDLFGVRGAVYVNF